MLFRANKVEIETREKIPQETQFKSELAGISQLQPNKKFIGVAKVRLWFYNISTRRKQNKFRDWMRNKVGEPPVLYDSLQAEKSLVLMENYLMNKGYFYPEVTYTPVFKDFKRKKRTGQHKAASLIFHVKTNYLYRIRQVIFPNDTSRITRLINAKKKESYLKNGMPFDVSELKKERERISDVLRNNGYYYFNREYVYFDLDSSMGNNQLDLFMKINPPTDSTQHQVYRIDQIYVLTDYSAEKLNHTFRYDTVHVNEFHFISSEKLRYRPRILISAIHFGKDTLFRKMYHVQTIGHLSNLGVFKYITLRYADKTINGKNYLDCFINLSPAKKQQVGVEFEANNNTDYNLGTSLTLSYGNKNIFRGTELLRFSVSSGFESNLEKGEKFFNTVDLLFKFDLYFNKFLFPVPVKRISKNAYPKSRISFRNEFLRRIDYYTTNTTTVAFGYEWRHKATKRFIFNPIAVNFIKNIEYTQEFIDIVNSSPSLKNSFTQQLILGMDFNYIWSNQPVHRGRSYFYYSGKINTSGNLLHLGYVLAHLHDGVKPPYKIFGVEYSQFFLIDSDIKNYFQINKKTQLVTRLYGGIGKPYGNSSSLAYVKQFFAGGANSMRGWRIRALGPGSYNFEKSAAYEDENFFFDQTGEVRLEANAEYRFDIYKFFKGALFLDMGNIWIIEPDTARPGANFDFGKIWTDMAIGTGAGVRMDFGYFVLRFDMGVKLREPADGKDRWPIWNHELRNKSIPWRRDNMRFNLALGYPF